jgi:peptide/nickel transport system substrate-binding protein
MAMRWLILGVALLLARPAAAESLAIALQSDIASLDPHVAPAQTGEAVLRHIYGTLVERDAELRIVPGLAAAWRLVDPTTWEFTLRPGLRFSDGSALRAEDVAFSFRRVAGIRNAAGTYAPYIRAIKAVTAAAPDVVRIETLQPYPQLLGDIVRIGIVSEAAAGQATTEDFNRRMAAIGAGPYKAEAWSPGDVLRLVRNPYYWGTPPAWDVVTFRPIANDAARLAALLSGAADLIDKVPQGDVARLRTDPALRLTVHDGNRSMFLAPNFAACAGAYATDDAGQRLTPDPLLSPKVRQALSLAINRPAMVDRVMAGLGAVANQIVPKGMFGYDAALPPPLYDPAAARRLLTEAGYPHGFHLVLHCSNGRYVNDQQTCLAVAQMLARAGIQMQVQAEPQSVFYARLGRQDFDLVLNGWGSDTGDSIVVLRQALHSVDAAKGLGGFNRGRYSNPDVDRAIDAATALPDAAARERIQAEAMATAMADNGVIPLYASAWIWGSRRGIVYEGSFEEGTLATRATPAR